MESARVSKRGVEENTLAILDSSGVKDDRDILDDKLSFLHAVRAASLASASPSAPTPRMYDALFRMLLDKAASLELLAASHRLLLDLDRRYPRAFLAAADAFVAVRDAWSPFTARVDPEGFLLLVQEIAEAVDASSCHRQPCTMKLVRKLVLLQYLQSVLQEDFSPRRSAYRGTMNWALVRESLLNALLGSRRLNFKSFVRDCLTIVSNRCRTCEGTADGSDGAAALVLSMREIENETCGAVQKLLALVMELDVLRKEADRLRFTSRADAVRSPALELVVDELTYDKDLVSPFLLVFAESKWKLEIALQYVWKYCQKPAVRTRKSSKSEGEEEAATLDAVLTYLSNAANMRSLTRKVPARVLRVLLSHSLEAYLSLHCFCEDGGDRREASARSLLVKICDDFVSTFKNLMKVEKDRVLLPFEQEALFTATAIVSNRS